MVFWLGIELHKEGVIVMLIDFHTHIFPDAIAPKAIPKLAKTCELPAVTDGTASDTLQKMDEWGVDRAVFHNIATKANQEQTINKFALSVNDPRLIPFAALHYQSDELSTTITTIKDQGFLGIKLHPDYEDFMVDDRSLYPIYDLCSQLNIMIMFHAGVDFISPDLVHATPQSLLKVHENFPNLTMILAHLGGYDLWGDVLELIAGKNVCMDTSMVVLNPADDTEARLCVKAAIDYVGPVYLRFGRLAVEDVFDDSYKFEIGKGSVVSEGTDVSLIATGMMLGEALIAKELLKADGINARVINIATIKPIDKDIIVHAARETGAIVTCEEHNIIGGLGGAVSEVLCENAPCLMRRIGTQDVFGRSGKPKELLTYYKMDAQAIVAAAKDAVKAKNA